MKVPRFLLILFLLSSSLYSQELPPIQNYSPDDYQGDNQNWMISQGSNDYMYIANNAGLVEYNGERWNLYGSPNGTVIRSVKVIDDYVFTGCYMEFGYWRKDVHEKLVYTSLIEKLDVPLIEDEQFWNILNFDDWVLFQSLDRIYIYNKKNESFEIINAKTTRAKIFKIGNSVYYQIINQGIYKIENGSGVLISDGEAARSNVIVGAFDVRKSVHFLTEQGEFYKLENREFAKWKIPADSALQSKTVYSSLQLRDGSFILGTISHGMYHIAPNGELLRVIDKETGLHNNTVLSVFEDVDSNVWLGLDNGISMINLNSPFREYIDFKGRLGDVYTAKVFRDNMYIGTNQGLFYKPLNSKDDFELIQNTNGQVWTLNLIGDTLFCGHTDGTFLINGGKALKISDYPGTWDIKRIEGHQNLLLQGNYSGLSILEKKEGQWQFRNKIEGFDISSRFFEFLHGRTVMVNHEVKGIYTLELDPLFKEAEIKESQQAYGFGTSLVTYGERVLYASNSEKGIYAFHRDKKEFKRDSLFSNIFFSEDDPVTGTLISDPNTASLWGFTNRNVIRVTPGKFNNMPRVTKIPISNSFRRNQGVIGFECLEYLNDGSHLIGASNGFAVLNLDRFNAKKYDVRISGVFNKPLDATQEKELPLLPQEAFDFRQNNFSFSYNVPVYDKYTEVYYQYKLSGRYDNWSSWSKTPEVSFNNLPHGSYEFSVRALIGNDLSNNVASYAFTISTPWYLSIVAIMGYVMAAFISSIFVHKRYKSYYRKQREALIRENEKKNKQKKLKAERKIVQIKNEKLKLEIESKNRELAVSTMSIIKKNEFLNAIKDQLKESENNAKIKAVIKTIDHNINNEDDWKFFEDAFNNADKDFLKKIKTLHPDLTSNDLRLCAYLRLNLSSKEIAPLLNISVRSVEVKRYRLRKKMNLPHENSLTEYILGL